MSQSEEKILCALLDGVQPPMSSQSERDRLVAESLSLLETDPQARAFVRRHHLVKALLRGETDGLTPAIASGDLQHRIMQAIGEEASAAISAGNDTVVAINANSVSNLNESGQDSMDESQVNLNEAGIVHADVVQADAVQGHDALISSIAAPEQVRRASNDDVRWWRPAAAFAVAASVVAVAVFTWYPEEIVPNNNSLPGADERVVDVKPDTTTTPSDPTTTTTPSVNELNEDDVFTSPGTRWASVSVDDGGIIVDSAVDVAGQSYLNMLLVEHGSATSMNGLSTYAKFVSFDVSNSR